MLGRHELCPNPIGCPASRPVYPSLVSTRQPGRAGPVGRRARPIRQQEDQRTKAARTVVGPVRGGPSRGAGATRMFATCVAGLGPLVSRELARLEGVHVTDLGFDGRDDFVLFEVTRGQRDGVMSLRTTDDVFVEIGRTLRSEGDRAHWIAGRIWRPERVERALSIWAEYVRPLASSMTFRVITRVLKERSFLRTDLRRELGRAIGKDRPKWKVGDPAEVEIWISEYQPGRLVAGLRLTDVRMRQRDGRRVERSGAL